MEFSFLEVLSERNVVVVVVVVELLFAIGPDAGLEFSEKENFVLQKFIENPMLVSGHRFTIRVYALVSSIDPLVVFLNEDEGIVKFTTELFNKENVTSENSVITQVRI